MGGKFLLRLIDEYIMHTGKGTAQDREAEHEQNETGEW
jgi:hypothetical protein